MKSNKDIFLEELQKADSSKFIGLINSRGKCWRCSNHFWDGSQSACHKNFNDSSCEEGQKEYFESYPGENLQLKYHKKYIYCKNYMDAVLKKELMVALYSSGQVEFAENSRCNSCSDDCIEVMCFKQYQNLIDMHRRYAKAKYETLKTDSERYLLQQNFTFAVYLRDVFIPAISDDEIRGRAKQMFELCYPALKKEENQ